MHPSPGIGDLRLSILNGRLDVSAALQAAFERAHALQAQLKAFTHLPATLEVANVDPAAPLAGIAVGVKDLIDTADMPTAYGSPIHEGQRPERDAWIVARLRSLGAHVLGKTVTTEFAWRHPGPTVNPWNAAHTPGGSSSGSAAAVAAGILPLAIGTQTLGSVIRPAAYCGVVGFKPSFGAIPRTGICALAESLDHVGIFTRNVGDAAFALSLLAGRDDSDPHGEALRSFDASEITSGDIAAPRIGWLDDGWPGPIDDAQSEAMRRTAQRYADAGALVARVALPSDFGDAAEITSALLACEAARHHRERGERHAERLSGAMRDLLARGSAITAAEHAALKNRQMEFRRRYAQWRREENIDVLMMPPASGEAPFGLHHTGDPSFCAPMSLLGVPAITLPVAFGPAGLPLGVQLVGGAGMDVHLLRAALWCERALPYRDASPQGLAIAAAA